MTPAMIYDKNGNLLAEGFVTLTPEPKPTKGTFTTKPNKLIRGTPVIDFLTLDDGKIRYNISMTNWNKGSVDEIHFKIVE